MKIANCGVSTFIAKKHNISILDTYCLVGPTTKNKASFSNALEKILGESSNINTLDPRNTLE